MNGPNEQQAIPVLNRLLAAIQYSLASYLGYARPWAHAGGARLLEAVRQVTADHQDHVRRVGALILARRGKTEPGAFPSRFPAYNDLALDYLAPRLVEHERGLIEEVARCAATLGGDPEAGLLAEDILAVERRNLRTLTELLDPSSTRAESRTDTALAA